MRVAAPMPATGPGGRVGCARDATMRRRSRTAGYHAVLVGEHLVTAADPRRRSPSCAVPRRSDLSGSCRGARPSVTRVGAVFVKICGITNEEDALMAVALGADAVGFIFAPSTPQVTPGTVRDIVRRLPPGDPDGRGLPGPAPRVRDRHDPAAGLRASSSTATRPPGRRRSGRSCQALIVALPRGRPGPGARRRLRRRRDPARLARARLGPGVRLVARRGCAARTGD